MSRLDVPLPAFEGGSLVPVATYLLVILTLSAFLVAAPGASPTPVLGVVWGVFLVALTAGVFRFEGVALRSVLPSWRTVAPVAGTVVVFWALYNLLAFALALAGVAGFETTSSRVVGHPLAYLAALASSLLFTAVPEELLFRGYLQQKVSALTGGSRRRAIAVGVAVGAVLFAGFHVPRWVVAGHGFGPALGSRLAGLLLAGVAYGVVYALTRNLWLVALFHATMNVTPFLVAVDVPDQFHLLVALVEYTAIVATAYAACRVSGPGRRFRVGLPRGGSVTNDR